MWLRNGLTIDCTRLVEEVGFRPRPTVQAVEDFVAEVRGRRVLPDLRDAVLGRSQRRRRTGVRTEACGRVSPTERPALGSA